VKTEIISDFDEKYEGTRYGDVAELFILLASNEFSTI
jgi:hypothetical protein